MTRLIFIILFSTILFTQDVTIDVVFVNNNSVSNTKLFIGQDFIISKADAFWLYFDHKTKKVFEYKADKDILSEMDLFPKINAVNDIKARIGERTIKPIKDRTLHDFDCKGLEVTAYNEIPVKMKYYYTDFKNLSPNINAKLLNDFRNFNNLINSDDIELPPNKWPILVDVEKTIDNQKLYFTVEVIKVHEEFTDKAFVNKMKYLFNKAAK